MQSKRNTPSAFPSTSQRTPLRDGVDTPSRGRNQRRVVRDVVWGSPYTFHVPRQNNSFDRAKSWTWKACLKWITSRPSHLPLWGAVLVLFLWKVQKNKERKFLRKLSLSVLSYFSREKYQNRPSQGKMARSWIFLFWLAFHLSTGRTKATLTYYVKSV